MAEMRYRLENCFAAVFPTLSEQEIAQADHLNVGQWDSVASVTLFATIEEEFGIEFSLDEMPKLVSFSKILDHLETNVVT